MSISVVPYDKARIQELVAIWNEVVRDGVAFPQKEELTVHEGEKFFAEQSYTAMAIDAIDNTVAGIYILHPNNIGRCGHIANASYAVASKRRGQRIGALLVQDCMKKGRELGFRILQFNAVVAENKPALRLYKSLGFKQLGVIPQGFLARDGRYLDIIPHYISL